MKKIMEMGSGVAAYRGGHMDIELGADEQSDCGAEPRVRLQNLQM